MMTDMCLLLIQLIMMLMLKIKMKIWDRFVLGLKMESKDWVPMLQLCVSSISNLYQNFKKMLLMKTTKLSKIKLKLRVKIKARKKQRII